MTKLIGDKPNQVPVNADLGTLAYQDDTSAIITSVALQEVTESVTSITSSSNAATIDLSSATNFTHTLTENVTYTFSNPATSGKASAFTLKVVQDSTDRTITWPASVDWAGGTAPTISTGSGATDYYVFITTDGGTNYYGFTAGQALATPA